MKLNKIIEICEYNFLKHGDIDINYQFIDEIVETSLSKVIEYLKEFMEINEDVNFWFWVNIHYVTDKITIKLQFKDIEK